MVHMTHVVVHVILESASCKISSCVLPVWFPLQSL